MPFYHVPVALLYPVGEMFVEKRFKNNFILFMGSAQVKNLRS